MSTDWKEVDGTISDVYVDGSGKSRSVSAFFTYQVDGHWYSSTFTPLLYTPAKGDSLAVKYDPADPNRNQISEKQKKLHWLYIAGIVVAVIVVLLSFISRWN